MESSSSEPFTPNSTIVTDVGIGLKLGAAKPSGMIIVADVGEESSVYGSVVAGDIVRAINGVSVHQMTVNQVTNLLKGPPGSVVTLRIQRGSEILVPIQATRRSLDSSTSFVTPTRLQFDPVDQKKEREADGAAVTGPVPSTVVGTPTRVFPKPPPSTILSTGPVVLSPPVYPSSPKQSNNKNATTTVSATPSSPPRAAAPAEAVSPSRLVQEILTAEENDDVVKISQQYVDGLERGGTTATSTSSSYFVPPPQNNSQQAAVVATPPSRQRGGSLILSPLSLPPPPPSPQVYVGPPPPPPFPSSTPPTITAATQSQILNLAQSLMNQHRESEHFKVIEQYRNIIDQQKQRISALEEEVYRLQSEKSLVEKEVHVADIAKNESLQLARIAKGEAERLKEENHRLRTLEIPQAEERILKRYEERENQERERWKLELERYAHLLESVEVVASQATVAAQEAEASARRQAARAVESEKRALSAEGNLQRVIDMYEQKQNILQPIFTTASTSPIPMSNGANSPPPPLIQSWPGQTQTINGANITHSLSPELMAATAAVMKATMSPIPMPTPRSPPIRSSHNNLEISVDDLIERERMQRTTLEQNILALQEMVRRLEENLQVERERCRIALEEADKWRIKSAEATSERLPGALNNEALKAQLEDLNARFVREQQLWAEQQEQNANRIRTLCNELSISEGNRVKIDSTMLALRAKVSAELEQMQAVLEKTKEESQMEIAKAREGLAEAQELVANVTKEASARARRSEAVEAVLREEIEEEKRAAESAARVAAEEIARLNKELKAARSQRRQTASMLEPNENAMMNTPQRGGNSSFDDYNNNNNNNINAPRSSSPRSAYADRNNRSNATPRTGNTVHSSINEDPLAVAHGKIQQLLSSIGVGGVVGGSDGVRRRGEVASTTSSSPPPSSASKSSNNNNAQRPPLTGSGEHLQAAKGLDKQISDLESWIGRAMAAADDIAPIQPRSAERRDGGNNRYNENSQQQQQQQQQQDALLDSEMKWENATAQIRALSATRTTQELQDFRNEIETSAREENSRQSRHSALRTLLQQQQHQQRETAEMHSSPERSIFSTFSANSSSNARENRSTLSLFHDGIVVGLAGKADRSLILKMADEYRRPSTVTDAITSVMHSPDSGAITIAKKEDQIVGFAVALQEWSGGVRICDVLVSKNLRDRGVGKKLMSTLIEYCSRQGNTMIRARVPDDPLVVTFFKSLDFAEESKFGGVVLMLKIILPSLAKYGLS